MAVRSKNAPNTQPEGWHGPVGDPTVEYDSTARNIAEHNMAFEDACVKADVKPTKRQAAKWRRGAGAAYAARNVG